MKNAQKKFKLYTTKQFLQLVFCENGIPSSKRVVGTIIILVCLICKVIQMCLGQDVDFIYEFSLGCTLIGLKTMSTFFHSDKHDFGVNNNNQEQTKTQENISNEE